MYLDVNLHLNIYIYILYVHSHVCVISPIHKLTLIAEKTPCQALKPPNLSVTLNYLKVVGQVTDTSIWLTDKQGPNSSSQSTWLLLRGTVEASGSYSEVPYTKYHRFLAPSTMLWL